MTSLLLLLLLLLLPSSSTAVPQPVNIGVILNLDSTVGQTCRVSLNMAVHDFYAAHPNYTTKLLLHFRDSNYDIVTAASQAVDLISNDGAAAILGPQTSLQASFVVAIGAESHVPVISFSATSPSVSPSQSPYFIRAAVGDAATAAPIASIIKYYGWRRVVPIYEDSDFGSSFIPFLVKALDAVGSQIPYRVSVPPSASDDSILEQLYKLKTEQTRVFVVHMTSVLALRIFANAQAAGMMDTGFIWIMTAGTTSLIGSMDSPAVQDSVQGVLGVKPYIQPSPEKKSFKRRWKREFLKSQKPGSSDDIDDINTFVIWAYDAVFALAMAAEASHPVNNNNNNNKNSSKSYLDLANLPHVKTGEKFLKSIQNTEFNGLAGKFKLINGELNVSAFKIENVVGKKGHKIGYWTSKLNGLSRKLDGSEGGLRPVIWPGDSLEVGKGFVEPTSTMGKMWIAVPGPELPGFQGFLNVERDAANVTVASGYVIDVFEAAVSRLPYALPFEYVAFMDKDGKSAGNYDTLVRQVPKVYGAVVGDVTIRANRANYVDFTLPYTVSGVSMVVPWKDHSKNAWIFVKPLTKDLWVASVAFFVFTGLVVWAIEHRINEEFRGPASHQIGTVFYFTFSTLVFSHKEAMVSNLTRVVVIVWVFVVFILQSSYTANLTSMLTVQQLRPTMTSFEEVKNSNENVGYLEDSFVKGFLIDKGFHSDKLKPFKSPEEYAQALSSGYVAAIVDEIPYLKVFLKDYCANYTMAGETIKTGGFGFVFPKGSPLVNDLSRAILNLTESNEMVEIERRWFGDETSCADKNDFTSNSLDFMSFWGLFLITGAASLIALAIYVVCFLYQNRHSLSQLSSDGTSKWVHSIARLYDEKDLTSHTFKREAKYNNSMVDIDADNSTTEASPSVDHYIRMGSPTSISQHTFNDGTASPDLTTSPMVEIIPQHIEMTPTNSF